MKPRPFLMAALCLILAAPAIVSAQLSIDQRVLDFQNLAALYAKRYAPYEWKKQALGFDALDIKSWLERVRTAKDDLEFFEIEAEYVGKLQDTHSGFSMTSSFRASLGQSGALTVDIYDGKVLIDGISRAFFPASTYPFGVGDEIVSIDGVAVEDFITRVSKWRQFGNPVTTRRMAVGQLAARSQSTFPHAIDIGDTASVRIRRVNGALEDYTIPWAKTGVPFTTVGPVPLPKTTVALSIESSETAPDYMRVLDELHNYKLPEGDLGHAYALNFGVNLPVFRSGFPANFNQRLGKTGSEFHYSGTYTVDGLTIGYLRIPSFSPPNPTTALTELRTEIDFFQKNTDGLVVDVMRNPGGGCYMIDVAAALMPTPFYFFGEQIRATQSQLNTFQSSLDSAKFARAPQSVIDTYQSYVDQVNAALAANRGMTGPIPACRQTGSSAAPVMNDNPPAPVVYAKPFIVLIDEFSISAADILPSMIQDNGRALLVGMRSSGGGGSVSSWPTGFYSESVSSNTNTLVVRKTAIKTAEYPAAPYVENIGARPDIPLDYMTKENLLNGGRPFVDQFTQILITQIRNASPLPQLPATTFSISDRGGVALSTPGEPGQTIVGYGRVRAEGGSATPSGLAIFGFRQNNVLVGEAAVPGTRLIQSGRIYAEINGPVNTGIAIANPNSAAVTISFYFTGPEGNFGGGSATIAAYSQIAAFLDQSPFKSGSLANGTFTFTSTAPVAAIALRGLTNERGEFLITTLPVVDLALPLLAGTPVAPHYADGGGWTTQVLLINPTDTVMTGQVLFQNPSGFTTRSVSYSLSPRASQKVTTTGAGAGVQSGPIIILPTRTSSGTTGIPPTGFAVFSFRANGVTVTEAAIPTMTGGSAFRMYAEASGDFDNAQVGAIQTGLAVVNQSNAPATITVELNRLDGSSTGLTGSITVPAAGQAAKFLKEIPGFESLRLPLQGVLRVSSTATMSVIGLRGRYNERRDFLITTTPPVNEATPPSTTDLYFPHLAEAGGYTTQFILFSGSPGQLSAGLLTLFSQAGIPLNFTLR